MQPPKKKLWGLIAAGMIILMSQLIPAVSSVDHSYIVGIAILLSSLILWTTEALPMSITTMLMICVLALTNIMPFDEAMSNIGVNTSLFIMASSGITIAVANSNIPSILTRIIINRTKSNSRSMVISLGFLVAFCSAFMSSLATCTLFNCIILSILSDNGYEAGKSNLGKCLMIAIPACAGIGGFMSPAGTPANILLIDILAEHNVSLSFVRWCCIGFPIGIIATGIFLLALILIVPPEKFIPMHSNLNEKKVNARDRRIIIIVSMVIAGWFVSGWLGSINTTMIAVIGLAVMFMPFVNLMSWESFKNGVNWDLVLTMGTVSVLMTGISKTGVISYASSAFFQGVGSMPVILSMIIISAFICIVRSFIPTTTAVVALLAPMLTEVSFKLNQSLEGMLMILAFWTASALLIVYTEPIYLITYANKYYKGTDLLKVGALPCIVLSVISAFAIPWLVSIV